MAIVKTDSKYYSDIADAIRSRGVSGSFKPSQMSCAIGSIATGGTAVADGVVVTARNASGNPTAVSVYGSVIYPYTCGSSLGRNYIWFGNQITDISFEGQVTDLKPNAFYNALGSNTDSLHTQRHRQIFHPM